MEMGPEPIDRLKLRLPQGQEQAAFFAAPPTPTTGLRNSKPGWPGPPTRYWAPMQAPRPERTRLARPIQSRWDLSQAYHYEDIHYSRPYRQRPHGLARVPARLRLEPRPSPGPLRLPVPEAPGRRPARLGN